MKTTNPNNPLHVILSPEVHTSTYVLLASNKHSMAITGFIINSYGELGVRGVDKATSSISLMDFGTLLKGTSVETVASL